MLRTSVLALCLLFTLTAIAQQPADEAQKIVATVNGEVITKGKLDALYSQMNAQMRAQYDRAGGKKAFLDNYIAKRLMVQEALKKGFDQKPDVKAAIEAARESAIFDRFVREVVALPLVSDSDVQKYYDANKAQFATPEQVKVRHIITMSQGKSKEEALRKIQQAMAEIRQAAASGGGEETSRILLSRFAEAARKYSEDGSAQSGGDLGWQARGSLDPKFEEAAFNIRPGVMSGVIESSFGYHLIFVEEKKPAGSQPLEEVQTDIREFLLTQKAADVMGSVKRLTNELRVHSKVAVFPENID